MSGIVPDNEFNPKSNVLNAVRLRKDDGIVPLNKLEFKLNVSSLLQAVNILGIVPVNEFDPKSSIVTVIIPEGKSSLEATNLMQMLADVNTIMLPTLMFAELTPVASSTGILALTQTHQIAPPQTVTFALMLEDIQDPGNLGSMLRTALGAGVETVYLSKGCTDAWSPKALRGGQGAQFYLPIVEGADLLDTVQGFAGNTYATIMGGTSLYAQDLTSPSAFIIGNEGAGITSKLLNVANHKISIPMHENLESLNAGAAAAICLFERTRQVQSKHL